MSYIPPHQRKEQTQNEIIEEGIKAVSEGSDHHFPQLGRNGAKEKSTQWEQLRIESQIRERVEARMAEHFENKRKEEQVTYATLRRIVPRQTYVAREEEKEPTSAPELVDNPEDEWIEVKKKTRKSKKKVTNDSDSEDVDVQNLIDNEESSWN
uniref:Uncharacterized protein n=1 Tax=viral metagenome TaxID=1070528 RepID=A0A6C0CSF8_9ZZZZ